MRLLSALEVKLSSFIIGILCGIWGFEVLLDSRGRISMFMELYGVREEFGSLFLLASLLIITGSVFPCRVVRHWGHILCPMVCIPAGGFAILNNIISAGSLMLPFIGMMSLLIMWFDTKGKPREGLS